MNISLVFPRYAYKNNSLPLGISYLASVLRKEGYKFNLIDGTFTSFEESLDAIKNSDVLLISLQTVFADYAFRLMKEYKKLNKKGIIIAGGPHPTMLPYNTFKQGNADYVISGEGEETIKDLLKNLKTPSKVKGVFYKKGKKIVFNGEREPIKNLDEIPFPARELFSEEYKKSGGIGVIASRGCPFRCKFCQPTVDKLFGKKLRKRSVENIIREIKHANKFMKVNSVAFTDDGLTYDKKWLRKLCNELTKLKINWTCNSRADTMPDLNLLNLMKGSGCTHISIGIESGNDYIRNEILGKNLKKEDIIKSFKLLKKAGITSHAYLMIGSPYEDINSIYDTIKILDEVKPDKAQVTLTVPLPGTYLYDLCKKLRINNSRNWADYAYSFKHTIKLKNLSSKEVVFLRDCLKYAILARRIIKEKLSVNVTYLTLFNFFRYTKLPIFALRELETGKLKKIRKRYFGFLSRLS